MVIFRVLGRQYFDILDQSGNFLTVPSTNINDTTIKKN